MKRDVGVAEQVDAKVGEPLARNGEFLASENVDQAGVKELAI